MPVLRSAVIDIVIFLSDVEETGRPQPGCRPAGASEHAHCVNAAAHIGHFGAIKPEFQSQTPAGITSACSVYRPFQDRKSTVAAHRRKHPLRLEHAGLDRADRDQPAARGGAGFLGLDRRVAAADDDRIAEPDAVAASSVTRDLRQAFERCAGVDQQASSAAKSVAGRRLAVQLSGIAAAAPPRARRA